jgi:uncharacterized protein involved in exopolysaccharide biosynthesis
VTFSIIIRLLETFFRRWYYYLVPFVAIVGLGVSNASSTPTEFASDGVITTANASLLSDLTEVGTRTPFTFETAASLTSRKISSLMGTDAFARKVADGAGVGGAVDSGAITLNSIRLAIQTYPAGDELLTVRAKTIDPELSRRLAQSTIDSYIEEVIDVELTQATTAENVLRTRLERHQRELDEARAALAAFVRENPEPTQGVRPFDEQVALDQLSDAVERADLQVTETNSQFDAAQLVTEQTQADIDQRIRVVDPPQTPLAPEPQTRATVLKIGLFLILGALVMVALVAVATAIDHTVRREADVEEQVGIAVIATVPNAR